MKWLKRNPNPHAIIEFEVDVPRHERIWLPLCIPGIETAIGGYLDDRTKSRARRILDAIRGR